jgi:hypothetical protein
MQRKICTIGWDGRSNPIYRFYDELRMSDHIRTRPTPEQVLEQFPTAMYYLATFQRVPLGDAIKFHIN